MELLSTLQEASGHPVDDLKKVMSKDKRTKALFQKHLDIDDITNKAEFLNTVKFFLLNNRNVIQFVEDRDNVKSVSKHMLKKLRELKPAELTQRNVDDLLGFVADLFREHGYVERAGISGPTRKELVDWKNANGRYFDLSRSTQRELMSVPGLRPTRPTLLYRGLLFSSHDLKERKRYDGQLEVGKGLKFLRSIREGSRIVDLEWDRASSWSTSKETAMQFAKFGSAQSNFGATLQWLERGSAGRAIDGDLGFIISTLARPEDILIDIERLVTAAHLKHGSESEMILAPGTYTCRVSTKYNQKGEVDPTASTIDDRVNSVVEAVREFARTWNVNVPEGIVSSEWSTIAVDRALERGEADVFKKLASKGVKEEVLRSYTELKAFYDQHIANLNADSLQSLLADSKVGKVVEWIIEFRKMMTGQDRHPAFKTPDNSRGRTTVDKMTPEQYREAGYTLLADRVKDGTGNGRYTDSSIGRHMNMLAKGFGKKDKADSEIHRKGRKDQEAHVDHVLDGFFETIGRERPADREEALKLLRNALTGAERNAHLLNTLLHQRETLDDATKSKAESPADGK